MSEEEAALPEEQEVFFIKNITFIAKSNDRPNKSNRGDPSVFKLAQYGKHRYNCNRRQLVHFTAVLLLYTNLDMASVPYCCTVTLHLP